MSRIAVIAAAILTASPALAQTANHTDHDHAPQPVAPAPQASPAPQPAPTAAPDKAAADKQMMEHCRSDHSQQGHKAEDHCTPEQMGHDHSKMDHGHMDHSQMGHGDHAGHGMSMTGALGPYGMTREASGTSWQPDAAGHGGVHTQAGDWMVMSHLQLDGVFSSQEGPRGDDKAFLAGMAMISARRDFAGGDALNLRAMVSPDPFMGKRGYPLLMAAGETADGVEHLVDRQHPHDLFMELSASYSKRLSDKDSVFIYGGLPSEPAFGPPAFMHRPAAMMSPEAPITHHWLDSTHITFGVATVGWVHDGLKLEASRFRGREPDEHRFDIETGELDSTAVRVSWNPTANWSLQASWADMVSPEQLEPDHDETRWSASALYTGATSFGEVSGTLAFGRKQGEHGEAHDAWLGEASLSPNADWTIFSRAERIETDELGATHPSPVETVSKISLGVVRNWKVGEHVSLGVGALAARNFTSSALDPLYGGDPWGGMAFVRLKVE